METDGGEEEAFTYFLVTIIMISWVMNIMRGIMVLITLMMKHTMVVIMDDGDDDTGEASRRGPEAKRSLPRRHCERSKREWVAKGHHHHHSHHHQHHKHCRST